MSQPVTPAPRRGLAIALSAVCFAVFAALLVLAYPELLELGRKAEPLNFTISQWHTTVDLRNDDGSATAAIDHDAVVNFPETDENTGLKFTVPLRNGSRTVTISDVTVTDANGAPLGFTQRERDGVVTLRITDGAFVHGAQQLHIHYLVHHPIVAEAGADAFSTDLWTGALPSAVADYSAQLHLDAQLASALQPGTECTLAGAGCETSITEDATGATVELGTDGRMPANSVLHVRLPFALDTVTQPNPVALWTPSVWVLTIGSTFVALVAMFIMVQTTRRGLRRLPERSHELAADVALVPPVAEASLMLNDSSSQRAFGAGVLELAERGALAVDSPSGKANDTTLRRVEPTTELPASAQALLDTVLFPDGATTLQPARDKALGTRYSRFVDQLRKQLEATGRVTRNTTPRYLWLLMGLTVPALVLLGSAAWSSSGLQNGTTFWPLATFIFAIVFVVMAGASFVVWGSGVSGRRDDPQVLALQGMRAYLRASEAEREAFRAQAHPVDDERLLPYAMLFGQQDRWQKVLGDPAAGSWRSNAALTTALLPMIVTMNTMITPTSTPTSSTSTSSMGGQAGGL